MSLPPLRIQFVSWDKEEEGVRADAIRWERWWREVIHERAVETGRRWILAKPKAMDMRDPPSDADLQIHLGMPIYGAVPWSYVNWLWMRAGSVWEKAHDGYLSAFDQMVWENQEDAVRFIQEHPEYAEERVWVGQGLDTKEVEWEVRKEERQGRVEEIVEQIRSRKPLRGVRHLPPVLEKADCPPVTIVTPTFQRKKLMEIAFHNLLMTDYPLEKIEWVVVEDNDRAPHVMKRTLDEFQAKVPALRIQYIQMEGRRSIGEKRNMGVRAASHEWVLFMDDDDHYPVTSFRRRMAWLLRGKVRGGSARVACCTTIALYDLKRGVSAVNVPPPTLSLSQRVSEATLSFHRSVWEERPFPEVSVSEGEGWLTGRESVVIEIPPQQMIVAFSHDGNRSSRRLPPSNQPPACFWNFPKEYLVFIHGLVGVEVSL